jgi:UDP-N-acetylglucosamine 3-dehydrogenase
MKEQKQVTLGMIGAGVMAGIHADSISRIEGASLKAIYSPNGDAKKLAKRFGARAANSADEIIVDPAIDAVIFASSTDTHAQHLRQVHAAQKHILCEKPVVRTEAEADEIQRLFRGYPKQIMVGHVLRFAPAYVALRDTAKMLGNIGVIRLGRCTAFPRRDDDWYGDFARSGGAVLDFMIHDFDMVRWAFGDVERVFCMRSQSNGDLEKDYAITVARLASGAIAHLEASWVEAPATFYSYYEVTGSKGLVEYDTRSDPALIVHDKRAAKDARSAPVPLNPAVEDPYVTEMRHFVDCVRSNRKPAVTLEDGLASTRLSLAALRSAEQDKPVKIKTR